MLPTHRLLVIPLLVIILVYAGTSVSLAEYPWSSPSNEKFPWLDYLASLTTVRNVRLVVLTRHEQSIQSLARAMFLQSDVAKKLGIVEIQYLYVPAEQWPSYIDRASKLGTSIDVAWGGGPTLFNNLDEKGYLMPINPNKNPEHYAIKYELDKIPKSIAGAPTYKEDSEGNIRWIGASISSFGFTVNKDVLNKYKVPMPKSWSDLGRPEYANYLPATPLIGIADPTLSTSNTRIFEIILQAKGWSEGWRILTLMAANARIYPGSGDARDAVIRGDVAVATTIDFYGYMAMNVNPDCEYIAPEGETIINADPIAIVNITKYPVHAAAFIAWALSEFGGQVVWLDKDINRIPVNPNTFNTTEGQSRPDLKQAFNTLLNLRGIEFNETLSSNWVYSIMYYFKATLVNAHDDLQAVWARVAGAYLDGRISRDWFDYLTLELSKPLRFKDPVTGSNVEFTQEYAVYINKKLAEEASTYQALMTTWENAARERYQNVLNLLSRAISGEPVPTTVTKTTPTTTVVSTTITSTPTTQVTSTPTTTTSLTTSTTSPTSTPVSTLTSPTEGISSTIIALVAVLVLVVAAMLYFIRRK